MRDYAKEERHELNKMGARAHRNSGRGKYQKADGNLPDFIVDTKSYENGFRITPSVWAKLCTDAIKTDKNKSPLLHLSLGPEGRKVRLVVIEQSMFEDIMERAIDDSA